MRFRRPGSPLLASIALHIVLGAALLRVLLIPVPLRTLFEKEPAPVPERIGFIALPREGATDPGRSGGDDRPLVPKERRTAPRALVAPTGVSSTIPAPAAAGAGEGGGSGARIGAGGPEAGIRPSYGDPRLWVPPSAVVVMPRTPAQQLDSALRTSLKRHIDSVTVATDAAASQRKPGDLTVNGPGGKWGIDDRYIRLGKVSIPNAALALLPLNVQKSLVGNPTAIERERAYARIRADIDYQSQRMLTEEELRLAARRIRERKDRERRERLEAEGGTRE